MLEAFDGAINFSVELAIFSKVAVCSIVELDLIGICLVDNSADAEGKALSEDGRFNSNI